jgi:hypothetical protein
VRVVVVALGGGADGRVLERPREERRELAVDFFGGGLADEAFFLVDGRDAHGEFSGEERGVEVEALAVAAVAVEAEIGGVGAAVHVGLRGHDAHGAGGGAEAEEIGVRPARDLDGVDVVGIEGDVVVRREAAPRGVDTETARARRAHAADAVRLLRIRLHLVADAAGAVADEAGEVVRALGAGLVAKHVVDIEQRQILHLLLGHDGDRGAEVLELRIEARAAEGVRGLVAVVVVDDGEGREDHDFLGRHGAGRGDRLGGGCGLRWQAGGEREQCKDGRGGRSAETKGRGRVVCHGGKG